MLWLNNKIERSLLESFGSVVGLILLTATTGYFGLNAVRAWQVGRVWLN